MKTLFSRTSQTLENKKIKQKKTTKKKQTYKNKNRVASSPITTGNRSVWSAVPKIPSKNEDISVLSSAPTLILFICLFVFLFFFTGQGKIFKGFHVCYDFSASKGGRKIQQCLFFLKQFVV